MLNWLVAFAVAGVPLIAPEGPPVAPVDIALGEQVVQLRMPLVARTRGARLILFVRDVEALTGVHDDRQSAFENAVPMGSVTAHLSSTSGGTLVLEHTGYSYYRGFSGLVLSETTASDRRELYSQLILDAHVALPEVRFVWLDRLTRTVRDVPPPR